MARKKSETLVASVAAFDEDGKLLFGLRQDNQRWTLPGGHLEEDEEPLQGAIRELREEAGLKPLSIHYIGQGHVRRQERNIRVFCYKAKVTGKPTGEDDPDQECKTWRFVDIKGGLPEDIGAHLASKNNVTLRLLDLQEGEVRKHEPELLSKVEFDMPPPHSGINPMVWLKMDQAQRDYHWRQHFHSLTRNDGSRPEHMQAMVEGGDTMPPGWKGVIPQHIAETGDPDLISAAKQQAWGQIPPDDRKAEWGKFLYRQRHGDGGWTATANDQRLSNEVYHSAPYRSPLRSQWQTLTVPQRQQAWNEHFNSYGNDLSRPPPDVGRQSVAWQGWDMAARHDQWIKFEGRLQGEGFDYRHPPPDASPLQRHAWESMTANQRADGWIDYRDRNFPHLALPRVNLGEPPPGSVDRNGDPISTPDQWNDLHTEEQREIWADYVERKRMEYPPHNTNLEEGQDWQNLSADQKREVWREAGAPSDPLRGAANQSTDRYWLLKRHPEKADPIEQMIMGADGADALLGLKMPGVTREHIQTALHAGVPLPDVQKHPKFDREHLRWLMTEPAVADHTRANLIEHPLMDEGLLDEAVSSLAQRPTEGWWHANSTDLMRLASSPKISGDQATRLAALAAKHLPSPSHAGGVDALFRNPKVSSDWIHQQVKNSWTHSTPTSNFVASKAVRNPSATQETLGMAVRMLTLDAKSGKVPSGWHDVSEFLSDPRIKPDDLALAMREMPNDRHSMSLRRSLLENTSMPKQGLDFGIAEPQLWAEVIKNPNAQPEHVQDILKAMKTSNGSVPYNDKFIGNLMSSNAMTPEILQGMVDAKSNEPEDSWWGWKAPLWAAGSPKLSDGQALDLINSVVPKADPNATADQQLYQALALNTSLSKESIRAALAHPNIDLASSMLDRWRNMNQQDHAPKATVGPEEIDLAMKHHDPKVRLEALLHPAASPQHLLAALKDPARFPGVVPPRAEDDSGKRVSIHDRLTGREDQPLGLNSVIRDNVGNIDSRIGPEHVQAMMQHPDPEVKAVGLMHPAVDFAELARYAAHPQFMTAVAKNPKMAEHREIAMQLLKHPDSYVRQALMSNPSVHPDVLREAWRTYPHGNNSFAPNTLLSHRSMPSDVLEQVADKPEHWRPDSVNAVIHHHNATPGILDKLKAKLSQKWGTQGPAGKRLDTEFPPKEWAGAPTMEWNPLAPGRMIRDIDKQMEYQHPDSVFKSNVDIRAGMQKLRRVRDIINEKAGKKGELSPKDLPPGDWSIGRLPNGNISAKKIDEHIKSQTPLRYNTSMSKWESNLQTHSSEHSRVLQVNLTTDQVNKMKAAGVYDTFRDMNAASLSSGHPVRPSTLGWIRFTGAPKKGYFVDEIQSDFGQSFVRQAAAQARERGMDEHEAAARAEEKYPEAHYGVIKSILFGNKHPNEILHEAFLQHLRQGKFSVNSPVHIHTVESKAPISLGDAWQTKKRTLKPDQPARLAAPAHMNTTYHDVPKKMGYIPGTYGKLKDVETGNHGDHGIGPGSPIWEGKVRKFEDEWAIWLSLQKAVDPDQLKGVFRYNNHDLGSHYVDHTKEHDQHPAIHQAHVDAFRSHILDSSDVVKRTPLSRSRSSNSTGKAIYTHEDRYGSSSDRYMVKPYHEKIVPRVREWMDHPIQGWAEMTNQALYHAGQIGHLHQEVHVSEFPTRHPSQQEQAAQDASPIGRLRLDAMKEFPAPPQPSIYTPSAERYEAEKHWEKLMDEREKKLDEVVNERMKAAGIDEGKVPTTPMLVIRMNSEARGGRVAHLKGGERYTPAEREQVKKIALMDFLSNNLDRHDDNLLHDGRNFLAVDHSRSFQYKGPNKNGSSYARGVVKPTEDKLANYLGAYSGESQGAAIGHADPTPYSHDEAGRYRMIDEWKPVFQWWDKVGPQIRQAMDKRLELIKDLQVREHVRRNFHERADHLDGYNDVGFENHGFGDWEHTPVALHQFGKDPEQ